MLKTTMRKLIAGAGIAAALTIGLGAVSPASADGWRGYGWRGHERFEHYGPRFGFGFYQPPVYYNPGPPRCYVRRVVVWGPYGYHPVLRRFCRY